MRRGNNCPRLATLPFDPTYKLMATFNQTTDASGKPVVRCFVKGAAPAVMSRVAAALSAGTSIAWDSDLRQRAEANVVRMGEAGLRAGRMILSDDNFATIVYAVEQGRKLYDNLNKFIRFVLLELVAFVLTFLGATLLNLAAGQPFTPAQILWINFLVNAPLGVALGFDKETPGLMARRPVPEANRF